MRAMIFAAGLGTRLKPLTDTLPKALVPLAGKTLLQWQIERLKAAGITDIVVNVHHFPDMIINYLRDNDNFGCRIAVSDERDMLLETGGGLRKAKSLLLGIGSRESGNNDEPILICNVDILSNIDLPTLLHAYNPEEMGMRSLDSENPDPYYADLEKEMLSKINQLGIGPQGFGGKTTAIGLNIETLPTHIAGMPCAININCHVTRHKSEVI